ncbi:MAG: beta-propeller domain-containing protein [Arenimonas sp.]
MLIKTISFAFLMTAFSCASYAAATPAKKTMKAFASEQAFLAYLEKFRKEERRVREMSLPAPSSPVASPSPVTPAMAAASDVAGSLQKVEVTGSRVKSDKNKEDGITNNQTQGVDEGDIVKKRGDYLVILRRGRLFTVKVGENNLQPVSMSNAYAPDVDPNGTWYDEMLISGNTIVVIGFSYQRGGTEVGLFNLDDRGGLKYRATYHLRSNDYYSSRNYASRLIGNKLIFYTPLYLNTYGDIAGSMPAMRTWHKGADSKEFKRILPATRIYRTDQNLDMYDMSLHTVSVCDLARPVMTCRSTAVLGPSGRVFYVSEDSVFVWTSPWHGAGKQANKSSVFRLPLDGSAPTALKASGSPVDQLSFLQRDGYLNVLVSADAAGDAMWRAESKAGDLAMLRVDLNDFGDGTGSTKFRHYKGLPSLGNSWGLQNRFVGDWFLYGSAYGNNSNKAYAVRYATPDKAQALKLSHDVQRIEVMGDDAIVVGNSQQDLKFTSIKLAQTATAVSTYTQSGAVQGESRSHGFFYRPTDADHGVVGLPVLSNAGQGESAAVMFLQNRGLKLSSLGKLNSRADSSIDDACKASCVDWYGNARPIFIGERAYALMGYELVEGRFINGAVKEKRRLNFAPRNAVEIAN